MPKVDPNRDAPRRTRAELEEENQALRTALAMLVGAATSVPAYLLSPVGDEVRADAEAVRRLMPMVRAVTDGAIEDAQAEREGGR